MISKRKNDKNKNVNLDALIQREDFAADDVPINNSANNIATLSCNDLRKNSGFFLASIRKPDFQRETMDWNAEKVVQFIKSFVDGEFIPAVILWKNRSGLIFVIDGSHRLSSLIAWVNDDYGDKQISLDVYDGQIPDRQRKIAIATRQKVNDEIGQFGDYLAALSATHPNAIIAGRARYLASRALQIQWIDGDLEKAERSFLNINQQAVPIDDIELKLIQKRKTVMGITARAVTKGGKGHKYWNGFDETTRGEIEKLSCSVHELLFEPALQRPVKTLDIPICDRSNNAFMLVYEFISIVNEGEDKIDTDGRATVQCLNKALNMVQKLNSNKAGSYGLHPIIYCYSNKGNFRAASFYSAIELTKLLDKDTRLRKIFVDNRRSFEDFIFSNDGIIQHIINTQRRGLQSAKHILNYYIDTLTMFHEKKAVAEIAGHFLATGKYGKSISDSSISHISVSSNFNNETKGEIFIKDAYRAITRCAICGGLLHKHSISIDHIVRKRDGGTGAVENGQVTHPYCNTGVKS